jgi:hypothetical protein
VKNSVAVISRYTVSTPYSLIFGQFLKFGPLDILMVSAKITDDGKISGTAYQKV